MMNLGRIETRTEANYPNARLIHSWDAIAEACGSKEKEAMMQDREKRRFVRRNAQVTATIRFKRGALTQDATSVNLGRAGAQFVCTQPLREGEPVLLRFGAESAMRGFECKGRVCWIKRLPAGEYHCGIRFMDLNHEESSLLEQMVNLPPFAQAAVM